MPHWLERTQLLVHDEALERLKRANLLLVGLGGVGSWAAEFLCRSGIGKLTIVDGDVVDLTNKNRQLPALDSTIGEAKTEVMAQRLKDINPDVHLNVLEQFLDPEAADDLVAAEPYDYVIDCIDSIAPKQKLIVAGWRAGKKVVSSMGAGGRLDPSRVRLADISETYNDTFAANIRKGLRKQGIRSGVTVVFSTELVRTDSVRLVDNITSFKRSYYGTISYMPALFGLYIASYVVNDVIQAKGGPVQPGHHAYKLTMPWVPTNRKKKLKMAKVTNESTPVPCQQEGFPENLPSSEGADGARVPHLRGRSTSVDECVSMRGNRTWGSGTGECHEPSGPYSISTCQVHEEQGSSGVHIMSAGAGGCQAVDDSHVSAAPTLHDGPSGLTRGDPLPLGLVKGGKDEEVVGDWQHLGGALTVPCVQSSKMMKRFEGSSDVGQGYDGDGI